MTYQAPVKEMMFLMNHLAGLEQISRLPYFSEASVDADTTEAILNESAKFSEEVLAPLNWTGDQQPSYFKDGHVVTTPGFKEAFEKYVEAGWQGVTHPLEYGGQGLPKIISTACQEMANSACLSFSLCPMLTDGAIEALIVAASDELKRRFIPNMISGKWTGTMNLTEPQAGSDLALVRTRAEPVGDGTYKIFGTKIYITYGEHDFSENIIHLVLARTPNAPEGVKGISLFVVPKYIVDDQGQIGERNDVHCISIEHKLGIKASPTAVLQYGDHGGAIGYLVGQENRGLEYMFIMMNAARFGVGMQGISLAERAYQKAVSYAKERIQSKDLSGSIGPVAIIHHPDVKRMLMTMRAYTEGARTLAYVAVAASDAAEHALDEKTRQENQAFYEFLVPIIKGFSTEMAVQVASLGVQVHGGMGFIEETGVAQYYRDARILPIYEGTTAIQANDLIGRKTLRDGGATAQAIGKQIAKTEEALAISDSAAAKIMLEQLTLARQSLEQVVTYILMNVKEDIKAVFAGSVPYLQICGLTLTGWQMARALLEAEKLRNQDPNFYHAKISTAQFYAQHLLTQVPGIAKSIMEGGRVTNALTPEQF
jgi:alkylation response protein AidB-like acyl-CoA dehydrogenase